MSAEAAGDQPLGAFDTDAAALARRIDAHDRYGTRDLDPWVMEHLDLAEGQHVLELGASTGADPSAGRGGWGVGARARGRRLGGGTGPPAREGRPTAGSRGASPCCTPRSTTSIAPH